MALSKDEQMQLDCLRELQRRADYPLMNEQYQKLRYLGLKQFHNCCTLTSCVGYEAKHEDETHCANCGSKLFKLNEQD